MKKQIISCMTLLILILILGVSSEVLATNSPIVNSNDPIITNVENIPGSKPNEIGNDTQWGDSNSVPTDYINNISDQLQNMASQQQPKDMRKQVTVMIVIIITVLLIIGLITWYYMTNQ